MSKSRAAGKAEVKKQAEAIIDELITGQAETEQPSFNRLKRRDLICGRN